MADAVVRLDRITSNAATNPDTAGAEDHACEARPHGPATVSRADIALVEALQSGAEAAYEELINHYQQPVYNLVYRLLPDPGDACDVVQEVFLKVFRNIGNFRAQSSLKTWVYRIALNEANNRRRWFGRHRKHEVDLDREDDHARSLQDSLSDGASSPFDLVLGSETQEKIEEALQKLSPNFRDAVVLRDIEELSYEEIAEILSINMGTVKSRILRGRDALRKQLLTGDCGVYASIRGMVSGD
jgi:RNA polymerase sigma-70 factor, ECF subfamily